MVEYHFSMDLNSPMDELSSDTSTVATNEDPTSKSSHASKHVVRNKVDKAKTRRKNGYSPDPIPETQVVLKPRILRTDIRRSYASMLANVINSGDFPLMYGMLETFFTPDFEHRVVKHKPEDDTTATFVRQGLANIATAFYAFMHIDPDPQVTIKETKIHLISNTTASKIVTEWSYSATSIYDQTDLPTAEQSENELNYNAQPSLIARSSDNDTIHKRRECGGNSESEARLNIINAITNALEAVKRTLPLREKPLPFTFGGKLTLYTDENKVITKMEMEMLEPPTG